jgi:hypothetical protein
LVETGFQPAFRAILPIIAQQLVPVPVKKQNTHKQYGGKTFQEPQIRHFLDKAEFFLG